MPNVDSNQSGYSYATSGKKIIKRAMRLIGSLDPDEEATAGEITTGLEALNKMLDSWNAEALTLYCMQLWSVATALRNPTLGPSGTLDMPRPRKLDEGQVFLKDGLVNYRLQRLTQAQWALLEADTVSAGVPGRFYYDRNAPLGTLNFDLTPDRAYTLEIYDPAMLTQVVKAEAAFTLPPSYADALDYNLAVRIAPEFSKEVPAAVDQLATGLKSKLMRLNTRISPIKPDLAQPLGIYDINTDSIR